MTRRSYCFWLLTVDHHHFHGSFSLGLHIVLAVLFHGRRRRLEMSCLCQTIFHTSFSKPESTIQCRSATMTDSLLSPPRCSLSTYYLLWSSTDPSLFRRRNNSITSNSDDTVTLSPSSLTPCPNHVDRSRKDSIWKDLLTAAEMPCRIKKCCRTPYRVTSGLAITCFGSLYFFMARKMISIVIRDMQSGWLFLSITRHLLNILGYRW